MYDSVFPNNTVFEDKTLLEERNYILDVIYSFVNKMVEGDTKKETFYHYYKELFKGE